MDKPIAILALIVTVVCLPFFLGMSSFPREIELVDSASVCFEVMTMKYYFNS